MTIADDDDDDIVEIVEEPAGSPVPSTEDQEKDEADRTFSTIATPSPGRQQALLAQPPPMTQLPVLKKSTWTNLRRPRGTVDSEDHRLLFGGAVIGVVNVAFSSRPYFSP